MKKVYTKSLPILLLFIYVTSFSNGQTIAAGGGHSLFVCGNGEVKSCGGNLYGQLGNGTNTNSSSVVTVSGITNAKAVAAGYAFSLVLKNDSTVWGFGINDDGQLGVGSNISSNIPIQVQGLTNVIAIAAGGYHSVFLKSDGTVWTCGYNCCGQLGYSGTQQQLTVQQVLGISNVVAVAAGANHTLFLKNDGTVWSCGENQWGELGIGTTVGAYQPVQVLGLTSVVSIHVSSTSSFSLFLKSDGTAWACGQNASGQLGINNRIDQLVPLQVIGVSNITSIGGGSVHSLFIKNDSTVWSTGGNVFGQLGRTTSYILDSIAGQISSITGIIGIAGGYAHSLFVKSDGTSLSCGYNNLGQLGSSTGGPIPAQVLNLCSLQTSTLDATENAMQINVHPNPNLGVIHLILRHSPDNKTILTLNNLLGKKLREIELTEKESELKFDEPNGIYFLTVSNGKENYTTKIIIQR